MYTATYHIPHNQVCLVLQQDFNTLQLAIAACFMKRRGPPCLPVEEDISIPLLLTKQSVNLI